MPAAKRIAAQTAVDWSEASDNGGPGLLLRAKHALFDRLDRWANGWATSIAASA